MLRRIPAALVLVTSAALTLQGRDQAASAVSGQAAPVRLAAIGDMGTGKPPQFEVAAQMVRARASFPFDFVVTLGDNIYTGSGPADFDRAFAVPYRSLLDAGVLFYASLGNHDHKRQLTYPPFNMNGRRYYAFVKGHVRFFALDSTRMDREQLAWLEAGLRAANGGEWKVCYFHHPLYSSGRRHGSDTKLRRQLEPLFVRYGVNVVLSGHDHVYERIHPQQGVAYFVQGASGQLRAGNLRASPFTAKGFDADRSFLLIEFDGDELRFRAVSRAGDTVDAGVIHRTMRDGLRGPGGPR